MKVPVEEKRECRENDGQKNESTAVGGKWRQRKKEPR